MPPPTLRSPPAINEEEHRATPFEIFFDLVFVFALTRIMAFVGEPPTPLRTAQGLLLLLLLWYSWSSYTWLSNQARADVGLIRAGTLVGMAAIFVIALVTPAAWRSGGGSVRPPIVLVLAYITLRGMHQLLYRYSAGPDRRLLARLRLFGMVTVISWIPLILGAVFGGLAQTLFWVAALVIDVGGQRAAYAFRGAWPLRSPSHFSERHGLVLIIALGESLISVGAGAGPAVTRGPILVAALLGLSTAVCMWWLYFENAAPAAGRVLARAPNVERDRIASDAYSLGHLPMVAGVIYLALGIQQVIAQLADRPAGWTGGTALNWTSTVALHGGVALYLLGRLMFLRLTVRSTPPAQLVAVAVTIILLPVGRILPALSALGLLAAVLAALAGYERARTAARPRG